MIDPQTLLVFLVASLAINLTPGPSILYVSTVAMARGTRTGVLAALGLSLGIFAHILAAALGVSVLLANSAYGFMIVKYVGAAYLVYLGLKILLTRQAPAAPEETPAKSGALRTLMQGALVDLLNPKIAIFFLAFFPQFVVPGSGDTFVQILVLGSIFIVTGTAVNCSIALAVGQSAQKFRFLGGSFFSRWLPGTILVGLGARLATVDRG